MKLSRIRGDIETVKSRIRKSFRQILHDKDTALYLQDEIITQRNGRYVVPVKEEYRYKFDGIVHDRSSTGQTLFMEPMISVRLNNDLIELVLAEKQEVMEVLRSLHGRSKIIVQLFEKIAILFRIWSLSLRGDNWRLP